MNSSGKLGDGKGRWSVLKITILLYPLGGGAAAVNIFFLGLMVKAIGIEAFSPAHSIIAGALVGFPFSYLFARHIHKLMYEAS